MKNRHPFNREKTCFLNSQTTQLFFYLLPIQIGINNVALLFALFMLNNGLVHSPTSGFYFLH